MSIVFHLAAVVCYGICAYYCRANAFNKRQRTFVYLAILCQALALYETHPEIRFVTYHFGVAIAHYALFAMIAIAITDAKGTFSNSWFGLSLFAILGSILATVQLAEHEIESDSGLNVHFALATLAYCMFIMSTAQMLETLLRGRAISAHERADSSNSVSLLEMEHLVFRNVTWGFVFLTMTIMSGILVSIQGGAGLGGLTHKTLFAVLTWLFCAILLLGRWRQGWRGIIAMRWYAASTISLALSYLGTIFVLDLILQR